MHEWSGDFQGRPARFRMTSVIGHVLSIDFPPKFQNWDQTDPLTLFTAPTIRGEANPKVRRVPLPPCACAVAFTVLVAHLGRSAASACCAGDCLALVRSRQVGSVWQTPCYSSERQNWTILLAFRFK